VRAAEFLTKRGTGGDRARWPGLGAGRRHDRRRLENLWPWFKQRHVPIWGRRALSRDRGAGLKMQMPDKRVFILEGKNVITTQDWGPNTD